MKKYTLALCCALLATVYSYAQIPACPEVVARPDTALCGTSGNCVNLYATVQGTNATTSYAVAAIPYNPYPFVGSNAVLINIDDVWGNVIPLPFCFDFFGQTYNNIIIGSNAIITFDVTQANQYCQWPISNAIPSILNPMNSIMAPWHDIDPSAPPGNSGSSITWEIYGTAPCREMVISWDSIPMFADNGTIASSQLVLHETTNIIDVHLKYKPLYTGWNAGAAILGIQDATGTNAYVASNYNFPTQWSTNSESWRFAPSGAPNYTFGWYDLAGNLLSNSLNYQVCPNQTTAYVASVVNQSCAGPLTLTDTVLVGVSPTNLSTSSNVTPDICNAGVGTATTNPSGGATPYTYTWLPSGGNTSSQTGLSAGTYTVIILDGAGCATADTVVVPNTNPPVDPIITSNAINGQLNQSGPAAPVQICFTATAPASLATWNWVTSTSQTSTQNNICYTVNDSGLYCVDLFVTDTFGCVDTANACVRIISEAVFSFPNVFTPNSDANNDIFLATTAGVKTLRCTLYDRWGRRVYYWDGVTAGWDGKTTTGKMATDGVYYWVAEVYDFQDKRQEAHGFVHLVSTK